MKNKRIPLTIAALCIIATLCIGCASLQSTVVSETTTKQPDGTVVTSKVTATNSDAALAAGADLAAAVTSQLPRIIADK